MHEDDEQEPKEPWAAVALALMLPGAGHLYAAGWQFGLVVAAVEVFTAMLSYGLLIVTAVAAALSGARLTDVTWVVVALPVIVVKALACLHAARKARETRTPPQGSSPSG